MRGFGGGVILSAAAAWVGGGGGGVKLFSLCSALQFSRSFIVSCRVESEIADRGREGNSGKMED